jgi:Holliday junction resolvase RusA-like endonuclease
VTGIVITLAGEPQGKGRARVTRSGVAYTPAKTRSYETALRWAAQVAMKGRKPFTGPLSLTIEAFMPIPRSWSKKRQQMADAGSLRPTGRPDLDNILKATDALNAIAWVDDSQVVDVHCTKLYSDIPRLVVTVTPIETQVSVVEDKVDTKAPLGAAA